MSLPRYYQPLEVPAYAFIWEAVLWVSFGRFPSDVGYADKEEFDEELGLYSFAWKDGFGGPRYRFRGFWWPEAQMAGLGEDDADWERYEKALSTGYSRLDLIQQEIVRQTNAPPDPHGRSSHDGYFLAQAQKALVDLPFIDGVHRLFQHQLDDAWSRIFQALIKGDLAGYGWADLTQDEIREVAAKGGLTDIDYNANSGNAVNPWHSKLPSADTFGPMEPMGAMMEVPRKEWSLTGVAPDARYVTFTGRQWWDVVFPCDRLFELFPRPLSSIEADRDTIDILNPGLAISHDGADARTSRLHALGPTTRGRKKKAGGEIEMACQELYGKRLLKGEKELALLEEASRFVMMVWGEPLPRSTFQSYMKPFKNRGEGVPEIAAQLVPEIGAGNSAQRCQK